MTRPALNRDTLLILAAGLAVLWVWRRGVAGAAGDIGAAAVDAASGVVSGAVGAVASGVGLPRPDQTTTDPAVVRWIIDNRGYLAASMWGSAPALVNALTMQANTGRPPAPGTPAAIGLDVVPLTAGDFARLDRLAVDPADAWRIGAPNWDNIPQP